MLTNLKLTNFKPFENMSIDFKPLTLLTGGNSAGKTAILGSIWRFNFISKERLEFVKWRDSVYSLDPYAKFDVEGVFFTDSGDSTTIKYSTSSHTPNVAPSKIIRLGRGAWTKEAILKTKHILLLEQPEAGLDAKSQTELGRLLASLPAKGIQVIVETHSDHLFNSIRVEVNRWAIDADDVATHYLTINDCGLTEVETLQIDHSGRYAYWPKGFFDEYDSNTEKLLIKSKGSKQWD